MKQFWLNGILSLIVISVCCAIGATAMRGGAAEEQLVTLNEVPEAVRRAILARANGATIESIERSQEDGHTIYEVEIEKGAREFEFVVVVGDDGQIIDLEAEEDEDENEHEDDEKQVTKISMKEAPAAVQNAFRSASGNATPTEVERVVQEGFVTYEIEFAADNGESSLTLSDQGELIEVEKPFKIVELPKAIVRAIMKEHPVAELLEAEAVQLFYYEITININGRVVELAALATGDIEDEDEDEDQDDGKDEDD